MLFVSFSEGCPQVKYKCCDSPCCKAQSVGQEVFGICAAIVGQALSQFRACCYDAANQEQPFEATCAAVIAMGLCGEIAQRRLSSLDGNSSYRNYLIDAVYNLTADQLQEGAKYEMR